MNPEINDGLQLYDYEAERNVIGSAMIDPDAARKLESTIDARDFHDERNRAIVPAITQLYKGGHYIDAVILHDELKSGSVKVSLNYLLALTESTFTALYMPHYAAIVIKLAKLRRGVMMAQKITEMAFDSRDPDEILAYMQDAQKELSGTVDDGRLLEWDDSFDFYANVLEERLEQEKNGGSPLTFPWASWNRLIDPAEPGLPILISGDTGTGKTVYLECIADWWAKNGVNVVFAHAELNKPVMMDRRMCRHSGIPRSVLRTGDLTPEQQRIYDATDTRLKAWPGKIRYYHCPGQSMDEITRYGTQMVEQSKCEAIFYDYMTKATASARQSRMGGNERATDDYATFKDFMELNQVAGVTADQLNAEGKKKAFHDLDLVDIDGSKHKGNFVNVAAIAHRAKLEQPYINDNGERFEIGEKSPETNLALVKNTLGSPGTMTQIMNPSRFFVADKRLP